jgi:hypothetical protein
MKTVTKILYGLFLIGPAALTIIMVWGSSAYQPYARYDTWAVYPILIGGLVVLIWHIIQITSVNRHLWYIVYASVNLILYLLLGFISIGIVTGGSL